MAVLVMIEAHTIDAWTRTSDRTMTAYGNAMVLAGFAAPLFLWLAGVTLVLSADAAVRRGQSRWAAAESVCRRGLEIFILAFLFRLQAFIVSPGAHPVTLFRVDILNIMGPAVAAAGVVWFFCAYRPALVAAYGLIATAFAMLTPVVRTAGSIDRLHVWVQWYIRPSGDNTTFTGFPWVGFVFAGAAAGVLLSGARDTTMERRAQAGLLVAGASLIGAGFFAASLPPIYRQSSFWTTSPTYFAIRVGVLMAGLAVLYAIERVVVPWRVVLAPLERLGQRSLFVYWIHVELVYGYASWEIHRRLPFWGAVGAFVVFAILMYGAVVLRGHLAEWWRERRRQITFRGKAETV